MQDVFSRSDELGPSKVIHVYEPSVGLKGILVVDNVATGPSIGGVRIAPDVSLEECCRLARAMTLKNAAAGLPHGGGKAVIFGDPKMPRQRKELLLRAMASSLRNVEEYVFAPDMGTDEECMAWVRDEMGRVVALPRELGGIPLDEIGATGWGLLHATQAALERCDFPLEGARIFVQGFGAVGRHAARFLTDAGAVLVGAGDSRGVIHNPSGIKVSALLELKSAGRSVTDYADGERLDAEDAVGVECDIWIPAARPDVINEESVSRLRAKLVVEGANIPATPAAEQQLLERGVLVVPDFIANAGGVICAALEYQGAPESSVFPAIREKISRNVHEVLKGAHDKRVLPRQAAVDLATERLRYAMSLRRYSLFSSAPGFI